MRITFFIGGLSGGGAERVVCNLANFLASRGHAVDLMTLKESAPAEKLASGVACTPLYSETEGSGKLLKGIKMIIRLRRYMKKTSVDMYVVMLPLTTILMLLFSGLTKARIIAAERVDPKNYRGAKKWLLQRLARKANGWVFQTEEIRQWYGPWLRSAKSNVIPNAINPAFLRPAYTQEKENRIVAAGRLTDQKNFELLIRSFATITEEFPEYRLTIYGKGPKLPELQCLVKELGIGDRVTFPGYVANMPEELEKARMFVMSSDFEGMPNALMEAMALGLPCVSTDCGGGGARFLIEDGVNGILVPVRDEAAMVKAMRCILSDPEKASQLGSEARKLQQKLSPECIYGIWEKYIQEICG